MAAGVTVKGCMLDDEGGAGVTVRIVTASGRVGV